MRNSEPQTQTHLESEDQQGYSLLALCMVVAPFVIGAIILFLRQL